MEAFRTTKMYRIAAMWFALALVAASLLVAWANSEAPNSGSAAAGPRVLGDADLASHGETTTATLVVAGDNFTGTVVSNEPADCTSGRTVQLQRKQGDVWNNVGASTTTNALGAYSITASNPNGTQTWRVYVSPVVTGPYGETVVCHEALSPEQTG